jgi:hypothetical protein
LSIGKSSNSVRRFPVCGRGSLVHKRYRRLFPNFFNGCYLNTFGELMLSPQAQHRPSGLSA